MDDRNIRHLLQDLEEELHRPEVRKDVARLNELLHRDFEEFGRSGRRYDRASVLQEFSQGVDAAPIHAANFAVVQLSAEAALLTYETAHVASSGEHFRRSLRASVWVHTSEGWRLRFHQGTAMAEETDENTNFTPWIRTGDR